MISHLGVEGYGQEALGKIWGHFHVATAENRNGNMFFFEPRAGRYTLRVHRLFNFCSHLPSLCCFDLVSVA